METDIIIVINDNNIIFCTKLIELIILYFQQKLSLQILQIHVHERDFNLGSDKPSTFKPFLVVV
jgi:hypothetical protein